MLNPTPSRASVLLAHAAGFAILPWCLARPLPALADDAPKRPAIMSNRWQEDWSVLADPALRTEPYDPIKYISLSPSDKHSYVSLGMNLRERFESVNAVNFGTAGSRSDRYVIQRLQFHADIL